MILCILFLKNNKNIYLFTDDPKIIRKLSLLDKPWNSTTRLSLLQTLEDTLFDSNVGPASDSLCSLPDIYAPSDMCSNDIKWLCNLSPTFVHQNRQQRLVTGPNPQSSTKLLVPKSPYVYVWKTKMGQWGCRWIRTGTLKSVCLFVCLHAMCGDTLGSWLDQTRTKCSSQASKPI